jgi:hypothetical protein
MQILFFESLGHAEGEGSIAGFGIIPCTIAQFHSDDGKSILNMWWNKASLVYEASPDDSDIRDDDSGQPTTQRPAERMDVHNNAIRPRGVRPERPAG